MHHPPSPQSGQEHAVYPEAVAALVEGRVTWRPDGVPILWSAH
jgi:phosphoribosylglycinamide formyltransferase